MDLSKYKPLKTDNNYTYSQDAKWFHNRIYSFVSYFESILKENEMLIPKILLQNGSSVAVKTFGYYQPDMITIDGIDSDNNDIFLILHINSIQIQFTKKIIEPEKNIEKHKIGFQSYGD